MPRSVFSQERIYFNQMLESVTNCIIKDSDGFIWVGTQDGLLRYDNNHFKSFRHHREEQFSLPNNWIWSLTEDQNEKIWIGTFGGGLSMWDKVEEKFYSYENDFANANQGSKAASIHALTIYNDSLLLVGTENGLYTFNTNSKKFIRRENCSNEAECFINDIYVTEEKDIYIATNQGVRFKGISDSKFDLLNLNRRANQIVHSIEGQAHRIYFGTENGLMIYNQRKRESINHFDNFLSEKRPVYSILLINNDEWYVGTNKGIGHFNQESKYSWHNSTSANEDNLKSNFIHTLYEVEDNIVWCGTRKGIHQFSIRPPDFRTLNQLYSGSGCSTTTLGMVEDKNGDVWICSRDGLMKVDISSNLSDWTATCHKPSNTRGMQDSYTITITEDSYQDLWVAYRKNGFSTLKEENGKWVWYNYPKANAKLGGDGVNQVFQDRNGEYWLATRGLGLMKFDPFTEDLKVYNAKEGLTHPYVFRIFEDRQDRMWISTANGGLCQFNRETETFECQKLDRNNTASISANMVLATNQYSDDRMLVCTTSGLNILENDGSFRQINTFDGLPNNVIYGALEDDKGIIWVSTNEGISKLDINGDNISTTNYDKVHGLASYEFNQHSFLEHSSGLFFFGGTEGITYFDPLKVESQLINANIVLTDFKLNDESVATGKSNKQTFLLEKSINEIESINLNYDQNSISFEFAALGNLNAKSSQYSYKMEGLEAYWVDADNRNFASYPNMPPGEYTFRVKLLNQNGEFLQNEKSVLIRISKPPWLRWWAIVIYALLLIGIGYGILYVQTTRTKEIAAARENERSIFRKKMSRDFHDEAGNKITMISLLTDHATRKSDDRNITEIMVTLQDHIQELRSGMQDFIWVLDPAKDNLFDVLIRFREFANDSFEHNNTQFVMDSITPELQNIEMPGNIRRHFLLIFKEAITNILKYADASLVEFGFIKQTKGYQFSLKDNGKGFVHEELKRINGLNNITTRAKKINSSAEIVSKPGIGTRVILHWNIDEMK